LEQSRLAERFVFEKCFCRSAIRRIGIAKAADLPWRYGLKGSPLLSKPFR
jgi:3-methyladenine DNA glycosylase Mpg